MVTMRDAPLLSNSSTLVSLITPSLLDGGFRATHGPMSGWFPSFSVARVEHPTRHAKHKPQIEQIVTSFGIDLIIVFEPND